MKQLTRFTVPRSLFTLLLLAGTAQAQVKITGGITNKYRLNGTNYYSHTFTNTQAITVLSDVDVTYLSVAGGGGGALHDSDPTGGGGAGGFLTGTVTLVSSAAYTVNVGAGGLGNPNTAGEGSGSDGEASYVTNTTAGGAALMRAFGGGGGGDWENGHGGGSGGGGADHNPGGGFVKGGAGTNGQGNAGANTAGGKGSGGGAGSAGKNGSGVAGGDGRASTLRDGITAVTYAAGGACTASTGSGTDALPNTGNGGGNGIRGGAARRGGNGGSGIVIVRYVNNETYDPTVTVVSVTATWAVTNGAFRIYRPSSDPGDLDYTIPFTMSGTATNGTDYAGQPATNNQNIVALSTNVIIPAGQASAVVNLYPLYTLSPVQKQATLTLAGSTAASSTNATVTFSAFNSAKWAVATVASGGGYTTNYTLGNAPNTTNYSALIFTNSGSIMVTSGGQIEYLLVAGGGGGTEKDVIAMGSGGGAGGMLTGIVTLVSGSYTIPVTVGGGGLGGQTSGANGQNGTNTVLGANSEILAYGGGYGVTYGTGGNGGSGGGAAEITANGGTGVSGQGNSGGNCTGYGQGTSGGGAGGPGNPANKSGDYIAAGGLGKASTIRDGVTAVTYATGGKGRSNGATATNGENAGNNTGDGGGGGMGSGKKGGSGGSGIVIVRFVQNSSPRGTVIMMR